jgi:hypothetical protein
MSSQVTAGEEAGSSAAYVAIGQTLQRYIDAARTGSGSLMRQAFFDNARVCGSYGGKPVDWSLQQFCELIDKGDPAVDVEARVVAIDYEGSAAMARLEAVNWRGTRYTDFFILLQQGDSWRISSKAFFAHARA